MVAESSGADRELATMLARRMLAVVAAISAAAATAGLLPGRTIVLGALTSDGPMDALRVAVALVLALAVLRHDSARGAQAARYCSVVLMSAGIITLIDPHVGGLLGHGATPVDSAVLLASAATCIVAGGMLRPR